jgi:flagellin-like hook-associated protein FlgL
MRIEMEELTGVKSQIEDTDYAKETANLVRQQLLQQASMQTRQMGLNNQRETVLALLKGVGV